MGKSSRPAVSLLVAGLMLVSMQLPAQGGPPRDGEGQFQGTWLGRIGDKTVRLEIATNGALHWTATAGQARGEGADRIRWNGSAYVVDLPFVQRAPLGIELIEDGKALRLSGQAGAEWIVPRQGFK